MYEVRNYTRGSRSSRQSAKYIHNKRRKIITISLLSVMSVAVWIFVVARISSLAFISIDRVSVVADDRSLEAVIVSKAMNDMRGRYLGVLSRANTFLYPKGAIERDITATAPKIASVKVDRYNLNEIIVTITERQASAIVCTDLPDLTDGNLSDSVEHCFKSDTNGFVFDNAASYLGSVKRYYMPESFSDNSDVIGKFATGTDIFHALNDFYDEARTAGINVKGILWKPEGEYEMYASNPTTGPTSDNASTTGTVVIYFNDKNVLEDEAANLAVFWKKMIADARSKGEPLAFDSIDLRYGDNVFYRRVK